MENIVLVNKVRQFLEDETRSCSMDFGCVTPLYVYRMFGGQYSLTDIEIGLKELKSQGAFGL